MRPGVVLALALLAGACRAEQSPAERAASTDGTSQVGAADAPAPGFVPHDSLTLQAPCDSAISPADADRYRAAVVAMVGEGVLLYAAPERERPCFQLGVVSAALRDSLAATLRADGVPSRAVTWLHVTHVPPDDIELGARARP